MHKHIFGKVVITEKIIEAAEIFTPERGGERRAIYLQNPGLDVSSTLGLGFHNSNTLCSSAITFTR